MIVITTGVDIPDGSILSEQTFSDDQENELKDITVIKNLMTDGLDWSCITQNMVLFKIQVHLMRVLGAVLLNMLAVLVSNVV